LGVNDLETSRPKYSAEPKWIAHSAMPSLRMPAILALAPALMFPFAHADPGVSASTVAFAQVAAMDRPAGALGAGMRQGVVAAFDEANRAGGMCGRKLTLDSFDDGYEPVRTVAQVTAVIEGGAHFGLISSVGTPTAKVAQPVATAAGAPFSSAFSGAGFARSSPAQRLEPAPEL
jgi:branched-chain amino acid transport system substrate-binding protein